ncbi:hypothetical protein [Blastochloris viridis]|uniref:Uncharacterized protein n=1 Tax=Blastochloris viridis TaxID=1079 RepID=A0A0P0JIP2_BLAVI|nr:hypothetical protein [Blastochloris viridis]ALK09031.1 hypothetical protein BVIR_1243 [Blastochloris viridis]CUU41693.1 hypothetical protein BVIRIDIS_06870 [Blastochloris viridis]
MTRSLRRSDQEALALICAIAQTREARITAAAMSSHHPVVGAQLRTLGVLTRVGDEAVATSMADHDDVPVALARSSDGRGFGYFSPQAGWVSRSPDEQAVFTLSFDSLLPKLLDGLDCPLASRPVPLLPGLLWEVGAARLPARSARVPVWVGRRFSDPVMWAAFLEQIKQRPSPCARIVLSLTPAAKLPKDYLSGHEIVAVQSVVDLSHGLRIDPQILSARLSHRRDDGQPVSLAADGASITVRGKAYTFTGTKHRAIIRYLFEAWQKGERECLTAAVLEAADSGDQVRTLGKAFKGRTDWREFIKEERGRCWLDV